MASNSRQQASAALLIGLGVGAGIALLFAPKSGKETREDIAGAVNDNVDSVVAQGKKWDVARKPHLTRRKLV